MQMRVADVAVMESKIQSLRKWERIAPVPAAGTHGADSIWREHLWGFYYTTLLFARVGISIYPTIAGCGNDAMMRILPPSPPLAPLHLRVELKPRRGVQLAPHNITAIHQVDAILMYDIGASNVGVYRLHLISDLNNLPPLAW